MADERQEQNMQLSLDAMKDRYALIAACKAGAAYSDALLEWQQKGIVGSIVDPKLELLCQDWHDKTHIALDRVKNDPKYNEL